MTPSLPSGRSVGSHLTSRIARCRTKANYSASNRDTVKSIRPNLARQRSSILAKVRQVALWLAKGWQKRRSIQLYRMTTVTPSLQLRTMYVMNSHRRITLTLDTSARTAPLFVLIRGESNVAWGVRNDVSEQIAHELDRLAGEEPPITDFQTPPLHADAYRSLVGGQIASGPAFKFPDEIQRPTDITLVDRLDLLERNFRGWLAAEIPVCSPIVAVMDHGYPVSVCFCATRNSAPAVEAGLETAAAFRGRGLAPRVTAAWACAIRASGRIPLYSTSWNNAASLAVARKLGLVQYASDWSLVDTNRPQGG